MGTRIVTLTGPGGMGKTRLAIETGQRVSDHFSGAVWFVSLSEVTRSGQIPFAILRALGTAPDPDADPITAAAAALPDTSCLLILDNFEHLVDEGASTVRVLLDRAKDLRCLVTSRRRLDIAAEQEVEVRPLAAPMSAWNSPSTAMREGLRTNASVQLFEDRARQSRAGFEITKKNVEAVAELCRRLDGIPLAIELAASWAKMLTPADMLSRLEKILITHRQGVPAKHRSVGAAIEGSYLLLEDDLRGCFERLSVFRGGWTIDAAAHLCQDSDILDRLLRLQDRSMILADETNEGYRGRMLEPLRAFASSRLQESGSLEAICRLHTAFYEAFAEEVGTELIKATDQLPGLQRLDVEYQNLHAALQAADRSVRLSIAANMQWFWRLRGHRTEGLTWLRETLTNPSDVPEDILLNARNTGGILAWAAGDFDTARAYFEPMLDTYQKREDQRGFALVLVNLANLASHSGDYIRARADYEKSLAVWRALGEPKPLAITLSNLGAVAIDQKDLPAARNFLEEAMRVVEAEDSYLRAQVLYNLAVTAFEAREFPEAKRYLAESLNPRVTIGDREPMRDLGILLARIAIESGADLEAACLLGICDAIEKACEVVVSPEDRRDTDVILEKLRGRIPQSALYQSLDIGRAMHWEQMLDYLRFATSGQADSRVAD